MKVYTADKKFGEEMYNILNIKLRIFNDHYNIIKLPSAQRHEALSIILKKQITNFYYDKFTGKEYTFENMIELIKIHFETDQNRQLYLSEWKTTTFLKIINKNLDKNRLKCLQILFDKLRKI